jgi:diguanylate cyclase (GGDEF)-like protein/PAS domain S-box-containing protein
VDSAILEAILETADSLMLVLDGGGRIARFNRACEAATGWTEAEVLGRPAWEIVGDRSCWDDIRQRGAVRHESPWITRDGGRIVVQWSATVVSDDDGAITAVVATGVDVTARRADERRHRAIVERASDLITVLDADMNIAYASPAAMRLLGKRPEDIIGTPALDHVHPDDREFASLELLDAMSHEQPGAPVPVRLLDAHGRPVAAEALATNLLADEAVQGVIVTLRDVRERDLLDRRFRTAFDAAPIGMALVGVDGSFIQVNEALCEIVGYPADALRARRFQDITHPDDLDADLDHLERLVAGRIPGYRMEKRYIRADGDLVWVQLSVTLVRHDDGEPAYFISQIEDVTDRRSRTDGLAYQAHHDHLTGLLNRHATLRRLEQAMSRRHLASVALLFADLDRFKDVNDTYGHAVGDDVLRTLAGRIGSSVRPGDAAGRLGGDEFVVVLEGSDHGQAELLADRLRRCIADPITLPSGVVVEVHASIGIAVATADDHDATALLTRADAAMYAEKRSRSRN